MYAIWKIGYIFPICYDLNVPPSQYNWWKLEDIVELLYFTFKRWLGHEDSSLVNTTKALTKETLHGVCLLALQPSSMWKQVNKKPSWKHSQQPSANPEPAITLILDFVDSRKVRKYISIFTNYPVSHVSLWQQKWTKMLTSLSSS